MGIREITESLASDFSIQHLIRFLREKEFNVRQNNALVSLNLTASQKIDIRLADLFSKFSEPGIAGYTTLHDGTSFPVFFIKMNDGTLTERSSRKLQFDYAKRILLFVSANFDSFTLPAPCSHGIFVFVDNTKHVRMSLIEGIGKADSQKRYRRYTFYIDPDATNRTFIDRMCMNWSSFDDIKEAFSVERLSDEFFDEYKKIYSRFVEYATGKSIVKQGGKWVEVQTRSAKEEIMDQFSEFGDGEKAFRDYVKKMMGRLVFLQFLTKKGWLGVPAGESWGTGDKEYMKKLFDSKTSAIQGDFLDAVLEPLFFDSLNTDRSRNGDEAADVLSLEQGKSIRIPYLNGGLFERDALDHTRVQFPAQYFADLFDTFERFNFTIDENDPNDAEIGVDPEMLGRIFENLLEDNKDKGAFYTPKEIVNFMCQESLIQYLGDTEENRKFVTEFNDDAVPEEQRDDLIEKLKMVKICDPAIGSGAFPMGMLNLLCRLRIKLGDIEDSSCGILQAKREIIQNNIYGVDIEPGAVDIARLRFWLSIVVDEDTPTPLPNFDYKIMQGNSLLESFMGVDLSNINPGEEIFEKRKRGKKSLITRRVAIPQQKVFDLFEEGTTIQDIFDDMSIFYNESDHRKRDVIRKRIHKNVITFICKSVDNDKSFTEKQRLSIKDNAQNLELKNTPFFLWHLYFGDVFSNGGFDIVIGNPPYGANIDALIEEYEELYSDVIRNFAEIYKMFFSAGFSLLREGGTLSFITPDTYLTQPRYKDLRKFIHGTMIKVIVDLGESVFPLVTVPVCISLLKKANPGKDYCFLDLKRSYSGDFVSPKYSNVTITNSEDYPLLPMITGALTLNDVLELKDPGIQYHKHGNRGENTLYQRLFSHNKKSYIHPVKCWYGQLVSAYKIQDSDEFFNSDYKDELQKNESVSFTKDVFEKTPKFLWRQTAPYLIAMIDFDKKWHRNTLQCGYIKDDYAKKIDPHFMLAVLNSSYIAYCYDLAVRETGRTFPQIRLTFLKPLPMVIPASPQQRQIRELVLEAIAASGEQFDIVKNTINEKIMDCFNVSQEQRDLIKAFEERVKNSSRGRKSKSTKVPEPIQKKEQDDDDARE